MRSSSGSRLLRGPPEVILPNSLMSAPATKVRPPPITTAALTAASPFISSIAAKTPSGTPGLRALTGGLSMVMTATSLSLLILTSLFIRLSSKLMNSLGPGPGCINDQARNPFSMKRRVAQHGFRRFRPPVIKMKIVLPGKTHPAVDLDATIADCPASIARVHLGDGDCRRSLRRIMIERPCRVVGRRARTFRLQVHVGTLVLHRLKRSNRLAILLARLRVLHGHVEDALHPS